MRYQVKLSIVGPWHRRSDEHTTACGDPVGGAYLSREWVLDENLCPRCFTAREMDTGEMKKIEKAALADARADAIVEEWADPDDDRTPTDIEPVSFVSSDYSGTGKKKTP